MSGKLKLASVLLCSLALITLATGSAVAAPITIERALALDPVTMELPAFHQADRAGTDFNKLFQALPALPGLKRPVANQTLAVGDRTYTWHSVAAADGNFQWQTPNAGAAVQYLVCYVDSDRWQKATLSVSADQPVVVVLAKQPVKLGEKNEQGLSSADLTLPLGRHLLVVRMLLAADAESSPQLGMTLESKDQSASPTLAITVDPSQPVAIDTILNAPRVNDLSISPDGRFTVLSLSEYADGKHKESWLEIRRSEDLKLERYLRGMGPATGLAWYPGKGKRTALTWETSNDDHSTVWLFNLQKGQARAVLENVADLGQWRWTPDGQSIIYEIRRTPEPDSRRVKHVANPADRQPWWRGRATLMQAFLTGGFERQLTAGPLNPDGWRVSPDSRSLIFFTSENDWTHRPFSITRLWQLDLDSLTVKELLNDPWIGGAEFSPDGRTLCLSGSPSAFDGLGRNLPDGVQANDYGGQLYLMDLDDLQPRAISKQFQPDVGGVQWSPNDGRIYARCTETQYSNIYRYDPRKATWEKMETGVEYTDQMVVPQQGRWAVARGTSANHPNTVQVIDLKKNRVQTTYDPGVGQYQGQSIVFGPVETWQADLPNGEKLDGMIYYPPNFDPARKYPLIVYYYGGTSPVTRDFGGRYPKNVWAGQGYVVYVPNPSGATGYGQAMAARHVNDWGRITAGEVIDGTKAFLAAHDFVEPDHVGCIGASYGGFLTEYLITQTDIFAAAVSHAGISSISSYWGEGMWGYAYGTRALANSYPWNNRRLYVEQSPLFQADKITTPLLLVHGDADINVPIGESDQLFTALKLLGRDVQYVQIKGQDHHILDHEQRMVWNDTILAFFAKHLKEQPDWWDDMYPEPKDYR